MRGVWRVAVVAVLVAMPGGGAAAAQGATWRLSERPAVEIGAEGDTNAEFTRVTFVHRTRDGRVLVANAGDPRVRLFGRDGRFEKSIGRGGAGPGELSASFHPMYWRDTLFAYDHGQRRLSRFDVDRGFLSQVTYPSAPDPAGFSPVDRLDDGRWLLSTAVTSVGRQGRNGVFRDTLQLATRRGDLQGAPRPIARVPASLVHYRSTGTGATASLSMSLVPFSPPVVMQAAGTLVWTGDAATGELRAVDAEGRVRATVRAPWTAPPVTDADVREEKERRCAALRAAGCMERLAARFAADLLPRRLPVFSGVIADEAGNLWIERAAPSPRAGAEYAIFSPGGRRLATLATPPGVRLRQAGADWALAIHTGDDDVPALRVYGLSRR